MADKRKKICIIGHFGFGQEFADGQTVKTKTITDELEQVFGADQISRKDTEGARNKIFQLPFSIFKALKQHDNVVIFPAHNGLRVIAPLLVIGNVFFHRGLHYCVIGGWLPEFLKKHRWLKKFLKKFRGIYVETNTMKTVLTEMGFCNIFVLLNCKKLRILEEDELFYPASEPLGLCTFSRVMKEKGIEDAVNAVMRVNEFAGRQVYSLDIYGQVDANQTAWFEALKNTFPPYIRYRGVAEYDQSVAVLKGYFALLFPTYYDGEGFAGTLIDSMSSGVPIIASDWKYNSEIINEKNGLCYKTHDTDDLCKRLEYIYTHQTEWNSKKVNCLAEARKYDVANAIGVLVNAIKQ